MLEFVAAAARVAGLDDYRVIVNVGPLAGQTVFHLHWHVLGGGGTIASIGGDCVISHGSRPTSRTP